jgi:hypothetical protein
MKFAFRYAAALTVVVLFPLEWRLTAGKNALPDLTILDPSELGIERVRAKKDPKTGFVVGGKNPTSLILKLTEINGLSIDRLEKIMRPGASSKAGFLGAKEKLLDVLAEDNRYVVEELGLTHRELGLHLHILGAIGDRRGKDAEAGFIYHGRRFKVKIIRTRGSQPSPFDDGTESGTNAVVHNLDTDKKLSFALLVPHMIERYGFYEGKGTPYRVEPRKVLEVLDFIKVKAKKKP